MSRRVSRSAARGVPWGAGILVALVAPLAGAQTIADYSRAQRVFLENAMAQAAARSAGSGASTPATAASAPPAATPAAMRPGVPPPQPDMRVSGVFASSAGAIAEVLVDSTPYLLGAGERVPGTAWQVQAVAVDRVVLARRGGGAVAEARDALRVFALPALR